MRTSMKKAIASLCLTVFLAVGVAWAVQTPITPFTPPGPYVAGQPSATTLDFTFAACDASNGNSFKLTGTEILLVQNSGGSAYTFTVTSVADTLGRTQDVTSYSVGAGVFSAYNFRGGATGWKQTDGTVHLTCSNALLKFAVLTTPQ